MISIKSRLSIICLFASAIYTSTVVGQKKKDREDFDKITNPDTTYGANRLDSLVDKLEPSEIGTYLKSSPFLRTHADLKQINKQPYNSLQQMVKGSVAGLYVQEPTGEPGAEQFIFIRGLSNPVINKKDIYSSQPTVFLNGVPLIQNNPFVYDIQRYDYNPIGPATNLLSIVNADNIERIEVLKDPAALAKLGSLGSNGAIWITTKNAKSGDKVISVNTYFGLAQKPHVYSVNASWEIDRRQPFYEKFATVNDVVNIPSYLKDSSDPNYYGTADWTDAYYKNKPIWGLDMSLTGGSSRANFRLDLNHTKSQGAADGTSLKRYGVAFYLNMAPLNWLMVSTMVHANRVERDRNKTVRDRLAEERYLPDLSYPFPPSKKSYSDYLDQFKDQKSVDNNKNNSIQGAISLNADFGKLKIISKLLFDYNEALRDVFYPKVLMENNNFLSTYFGYNQRFMIDNYATYSLFKNDKHAVDIELGQTLRSDKNKYDYLYAYNSPNDFVKVRSTYFNSSGNYTSTSDMYAFPFTDKEMIKLSSFYGRLGYNYKNIVHLSGVLRREGVSNLMTDNRWLTSPVVSAEYDIKKHLFKGESFLSTLGLRLSWGRFGKVYQDDKYSLGPLYKVDLGWTDEPVMGSVNGNTALSRPYTDGWVGYGIKWPYSDKTNLGVDVGLFNDRARLSIDVYNNNEKDQIAPVPIPREYGYTSGYESGMDVNNKGIDVFVSAQLIKNLNGISWSINANGNYNKNKLTKLPNGLKSITYDNRYFEVGKQIDGFWLFKNEGIYSSDSDIPVDPNSGQKMSYNGVAFGAGDAKWKDLNGDNIINNQDKSIMGHYLPVVSGGIGSSVDYKKFSFDFQFSYALGNKILNQEVSSRLDFVNNETNPTINSVKEIFYWKKTFDPAEFPTYNPWSRVVPYRLDQDLFMQNASYLKLRTVSLEYRLIERKSAKSVFSKATIYTSVSNVFTISPFHKYGNPDFVDYSGVYTGYGMEYPRNYIVGAKFEF